jgi:hypothetical protein
MSDEEIKEQEQVQTTSETTGTEPQESVIGGEVTGTAQVESTVEPTPSAEVPSEETPA